MANSTNYKPNEGKREEFRRYLEKTGVMDALTKVLVLLYEEADKPDDALKFILNALSRQVGGESIEELQAQVASLQEKVGQLESGGGGAPQGSATAQPAVSATAQSAGSTTAQRGGSVQAQQGSATAQQRTSSNVERTLSGEPGGGGSSAPVVGSPANASAEQQLDGAEEAQEKPADSSAVTIEEGAA